MTGQPVQVRSTPRTKNRAVAAALAIFLWVLVSVVAANLTGQCFTLGQYDMLETWWHNAGRVYPYADRVVAMRVFAYATGAALGLLTSLAVGVTCEWKVAAK